MFILRLLLPIVFLSSSLIAQNVMDDFSDGDLLNPDWQGDLTNFTVDNEQLRLMADGAGSSELTLIATTSTVDLVTYEFLMSLDFATSAGNYAQVFLRGFDANGPVAYRLRIGGISGADDALVFTQSYDNVSDAPILSGTMGAVGGDPVTARIRLTRSVSNEWTLFADYTGGTDFTSEATGVDALPAPADLTSFSFSCLYTASRSDAMFFDDVSIGPIVEDLTPPQIIEAIVSSDNRITLSFTEPVQETSAAELENYEIDLGSPEVSNVQFNGNGVELTFDGPLPVGQNFQLLVMELVDLVGNSGGPYTQDILIEPTAIPRFGNLILSEFMADPTPQVGLPPVEYVEIYNRTDTVMILDGLEIASGGGGQVVAPYRLAPRDYVMIVAASNADEFPVGTKLVTVSSLPALSNGGDEIDLIYNGEILQHLEYDLFWYDDFNRIDGGFSLELTDVDTESPNCRGLWAASRATEGGTPGAANSVAGLVRDSIGPVLLRGEVLAGGFVLSFDEDLGLNIDLGSFSITPDLGITALTPLTEVGSYRLDVANEPTLGTVYTVTVSNEVSDCAGNFSAANSSIQLGIAEEVAVGDVVINEILFNPVSGGVDFVEVYNCSSKILNVAGWTLANKVTLTGSNRERINESALLLPNGYLVFTPIPEIISLVYPTQAQPQFLIENRLPSLPNDEGNITLIAANGDELDSFDYNEDQQSGLLDDDDGVSLERVNPKSATQNDGNWFSAASQVGFATPTRENSQRRDVVIGTGGDEFFFLDEDTVSPDGDGFQDALLIRYNTPGPGWNARIRIYDANGRLVKVLRRAELLAGEGTIIWDGSTENDDRARTGIYVILVERFEPDGGTANEKLVAVVVNPK